MNKINISIFVSGTGTNFLAIHKASKNKKFLGKINLVICDKGCPAFYLSKSLGYNTIVINKNCCDFENLINDHLIINNINLICLAGFMTILSSHFVKKWKGKILNIHPSILPLYPGLNTHNKVLKSGMKFHGSTVHIVDKNIDSGKIIGQFIFPIDPDSNKDDLIKKVKKNENYFYPKVINKYIWTYFKKKYKLKSEIFSRNNVVFSY